jgi:hypothetical protein
MKKIIIEWGLPGAKGGEETSVLTIEGPTTNWEVLGVLRHYSKYLEINKLIAHQNSDKACIERMKKEKKGKKDGQSRH